MNTLDFSQLPDVVLGRAVWSMPDDLRKALSDFPETAARCEASMWFAYKAAESTDQYSADTELPRREAFLRAALAEYSSMDDSLRWDCKNVLRYRMFSSSNPLVHLVRLLRHVNIHLTKTTLQPEIIQATWIGAAPDNTDYSSSFAIWTIPQLDSSRLATLQDSKHYSAGDMDRVCAWFNLYQRTWGAPDLVWRAAECFAKEVIQAGSH
jgi:hypothetical protein